MAISATSKVVGAAKGRQGVRGQPLRQRGLGLLPGGGGTQRLPRLVGKGRALQLILTGETISAQEAYRIGLVNEIVPAADLITRGEEILKQISANAPIAVKFALEVTKKGLETSQSVSAARQAAARSSVPRQTPARVGCRSIKASAPPIAAVVRKPLWPALTLSSAPWVAVSVIASKFTPPSETNATLTDVSAAPNSTCFETAPRRRDQFVEKQIAGVIIGKDEGLHIDAASRAFIGIAPRAKGIAGRPLEKMLDNMSGARFLALDHSLGDRPHDWQCTFVGTDPSEFRQCNRSG